MVASRLRSTERLLIVDSDGSMGTFATRVLRRAGFDTTHVASGEDALAALADGNWHGLLADAQLPGMSGLELTAAVRDAYPELPIAVVTGYLSSELNEQLERSGADAVLTRPLTPAGLASGMHELMAEGRSRRCVGPS
jgi:CheY-like chemotaxis protein